MRVRTWMFGLVAAGLIVGCSEDLKASDNDNGGGDGVFDVDASAGEEALPRSEKVRSVAQGDHYLTQVDATDKNGWVGFSFTQKGEAEGEAAELFFKYQAVRLAPGVEGVVIDMPFERITLSPLSGWEAEPEGSENVTTQEHPTGPLAQWYNYNMETHAVGVKDHSYAVRTPDGGCYKIHFTGFYDDAGTDGFMNFQWGPIDGCFAGE